QFEKRPQELKNRMHYLIRTPLFLQINIGLNGLVGQAYKKCEIPMDANCAFAFQKPYYKRNAEFGWNT
ncbi:MAG: hypothetical protein KAI86_09080, partial [Desulfobacterales bacterium]|nr:hypothetical protein [Desulfobacterales bacterium]